MKIICDICEKTFASFDDAIDHLAVYHTDIFTKKVCELLKTITKVLIKMENKYETKIP